MEPKLFQRWIHGRLSLRNRVVMAPMTRRMADEGGLASAESADYYARRAENEVGLIISEGTAIDETHSFDTPTVPRIATPAQWEAWKRVVDKVHAAGSAFAPQIWHTGRLAQDPIGPSAAPGLKRADGTTRPDIKEMDAADFTQVMDAYRRAARGSVEIGSDAVEIHGAHGYLLDSFLSPVNNQRSDEYGGSTEARMRFPLEVTRAVREEVGPGFPIIYRFSQWKMDDYRELKFRTSEELGVWVHALKDAGVDILHVSTRDATDPGFEDEGPMTLAGWSRKLSGLPTIAVGKVSVTLGMDEAYGETKDRIVDPQPWIDLVERDEVDLLAVGRALIANPDWVPKVRSGNWSELATFDKSQLQELH